MTAYIPCTPGGTICTWLAADTEADAWSNLIEDMGGGVAAPEIIEGLVERGYEVARADGIAASDLT